jgi:endonuclease-3
MRARTKNIARAIRVGGLANQKSQRIQAMLVWLKKEYGELTLDSIFDMDFDQALERFGHLKGVGVKTLAVVLMFACGKDVFPVDTHVHRLCGRLELVPAKATADKTFELMKGNVPKGKSYSLHMNMLSLGRTICHPGKPKCNECPVLRYCPFGQENLQK